MLHGRFVLAILRPMIVAFALLSGVSAFGQSWQRTALFPVNATPKAVACAEGRVAVVACSDGVLAYRTSTDAPAGTWEYRQTEVWNDLYDVALLSQAGVVVVGSGGTILRSTDDVDLPTAVPSPTTMALRAVATLASTAVAVGDGGTILRSTDDGASWSAVDAGTEAHLVDVAAVAGGVWLAVAENTDLRSTDDGQTWSIAPVADTVRRQRLCTTPSMIGRLSSPFLYETSGDGGATWSVHPLPGTDMQDPTRIDGHAVSISPSGDVHSLLLTNPYLPKSYHFVSTDGGSTWVDHHAVIARSSVGPDEVMVDERTIIRPLAPGRISTLRTDDGSWATYDHVVSTIAVNDVVDLDGGHTLAVSGGILQQAGDGLPMVPTYTLPPDHVHRSMVAVDNDVAFITHDTSWVDYIENGVRSRAWGTISRTTDGGRTWSAVYRHPDTVGFGTISVADRRIVAFSFGSRLATSTDDGATWNTVPVTTGADATILVNVGVAVSPTTWLAAAYRGTPLTPHVMRTTDAGSSWTAHAVPFAPRAMMVTAGGRVVMVGWSSAGSGSATHDRIATSDDTGRTWSEAMNAPNAPVSGLWGIDGRATTLAAFGPQGKLLLSYDGGVSWILDTAMATIARGTIIRTVDIGAEGHTTIHTSQGYRIDGTLPMPTSVTRSHTSPNAIITVDGTIQGQWTAAATAIAADLRGRCYHLALQHRGPVSSLGTMGLPAGVYAVTIAEDGRVASGMIVVRP